MLMKNGGVLVVQMLECLLYLADHVRSSGRSATLCKGLSVTFPSQQACSICSTQVSSIGLQLCTENTPKIQHIACMAIKASQYCTRITRAIYPPDKEN